MAIKSSPELCAFEVQKNEQKTYITNTTWIILKSLNVNL